MERKAKHDGLILKFSGIDNLQKLTLLFKYTLFSPSLREIPFNLKVQSDSENELFFFPERREMLMRYSIFSIPLFVQQLLDINLWLAA